MSMAFRPMVSNRSNSGSSSERMRAISSGVVSESICRYPSLLKSTSGGAAEFVVINLVAAAFDAATIFAAVLRFCDLIVMMAPSLKSPNGLSDTAAKTTFTAIRTVTEALFTRARPTSRESRARGSRAAPQVSYVPHRGSLDHLLNLSRGLLAAALTLPLLAACVFLPTPATPVAQLSVSNPHARGGVGRAYEIRRATEGARAASSAVGASC